MALKGRAGLHSRLCTRCGWSKLRVLPLSSQPTCAAPNAQTQGVAFASASPLPSPDSLGRYEEMQICLGDEKREDAGG